MSAESPLTAAEMDAFNAAISGSIGAMPVSTTTERLPLTATVHWAVMEALPADATAEQIETALVQLRESLPLNADRLTRETLRAKIRQDYPNIPSRMVDAAMAAPARSTASTDPAKPPHEAELQGTAVMLQDDAPWHGPVNVGALLAETAETIRRYVVVSPAQADAISLWIGMAHAIDSLAIAPILALVSATMRSGKTTACIVVGALAPRAILLSSVTTAVLFRLIEKYRPTLIADEADTWLTDERSDLRGVINAGHTKATAQVARCAGDTNDVRLFSVWCARVVAAIGRLPGTIRDRSLVIELRRKTSAEPVERLRADRLHDDLAPLRRQWRRWTTDHAEAIRRSDPVVHTSLHDRAADCWRPLLAIADLAGGDWPERARAASAELSGQSDADEEGIAIELLHDIQAVFVDRGADVLASAELADALAKLSDRPWAEWSHGRPLTAAKLARLVKPFGIIPIDIKVSGKTLKRYRRDTFADAWGRYLPTKPQLCNPTNDYGPQTAISEVQPVGPVALSKTPNGPMFTGSGCGVALLSADSALGGRGGDDGIF